jgi:hypothetical protein
MMAEAGVVGVDVIVKVGDVAILGQRGAKMSYPMDMIDLSVKADYPYKKGRPGWEGPITIDCDCLMEAGGPAGMAGLINTVQARTLVEVVVTIGESGEELSGDAWMLQPEFDAPQGGEATMSCRLQIDGQLTATEGS